MEEFISSQDRKCRQAFHALLISPLDAEHRTHVIDEFDRYKIWAANFGAAHSGPNYQKSLDYRLRKAPAYKEQILAILMRLEQLLDQAHAYATGTSNDQVLHQDSSDDELDDDDPHASNSWALTDSEDEDDPTDSIKTLESHPGPQAKATGLEWLSREYSSRLQPTVQSINFTITCLYRIPVRETASETRLRRHHDYKSQEFDMYAHFDQLFVRDAFPLADQNVVSRLAKLITERRRVLRYRQQHNDELQRESVESQDAKKYVSSVVVPMKDVSKVALHNTAGTERPSSTIPKSSLKASTFHPQEGLALDSQNLLPGASSDADDVSSIAATIVKEEMVLVPPRPRDFQGKEREDFICPYCCVSRHIRSSHAWRYVCSCLYLIFCYL